MEIPSEGLSSLYPRDQGLSSQSNNVGSHSTTGVPGGRLVNHNWVVNNVDGSVHTIINNTSISNYLTHANAPESENAIKAKIATALQTRHVPEAVYDAQLGWGCMKGTRVQVLNTVNSWVKDPMSPQIFWLTGHAGSGKSAIATTVCSSASEDPEIVLGGSFFCSRSAGSVAQRDARCIVPTLAQLLARQSPEFSHALAEELDRDPDILHKQITTQIERLLQSPLHSLKDSRVHILFVIDALDECGGQITGNSAQDDPDSHRIVSDMLEALVGFSRSSTKLPVKFLVTSRPETHIRDTHVSDSTFSKVFQLHTVDKEQVTQDIRHYIATRFSSAQRLREWLTEDDIDMLVRLCDGLFLVATTALKYVLGAGTDHAPIRLKTLLNFSRNSLSDGAAAPLDQMYELILSDAARAEGPAGNAPQAMLQAIASLLAARTTLSVSALADLLNIPMHHLRASLALLHSVVHIPEGDDEPGLRTLHASFGDYLLERADDRYRIDRTLGDAVLARGCLRVLINQLHFNVSQSRSSYQPNQPRKSDTVTLALEYGCLHWIFHIARTSVPAPSDRKSKETWLQWLWSFLPCASSMPASDLDEAVDSIFRPRLLSWLEVMSILGQVRRAAAMLVFAARTVQSTELSRFFSDANSFVASSQEAIERSAPHIYLSALPFSDKNSLVYKEFAPLCTGLITVDLFGTKHHAGRLAMSLAGHDDGVNSVTYSPDGRMIGSGSADGTVRIWDMRTGEEAMLPLRSGDGSVLSVSFSPIDMSLASGTEAGIVCVWWLLSGKVTPQRLIGHSDAVLAVTFSFDGSRLASGSRDRTARIWIIASGQQLAVLNGHTDRVTTVAFSPDGNNVASGSWDGMIRLWHGGTGQLTHRPPADHIAAVRSLCFSPDGQIIAAACGIYVMICSVRTGKELTTLLTGSDAIQSIGFCADGRSLVLAHNRGVCVLTLPRFPRKASLMLIGTHPDQVHSVTFSPDGLYIASASNEHTIRIWNVASGVSKNEPVRGHKDHVNSVAISRDGALLISGGDDCSVRIWDARTGEQKLPDLLGHTDIVLSVALSPDERLIASASEDQTIRLWDVRTGKRIGTTIRNITRRPNVITFSPDSQRLASSFRVRSVQIWDVMTQQPLSSELIACGDFILAFAFSPDGRLLAAGTADGHVHLWVTEARQPAREALRVSSREVKSIGFSPNGERIASSSDWSVVIWNIFTGQQLLTIDCMANFIAYSFDARLIACCVYSGAFEVYCAETGAMIASLPEVTSRMTLSATFSPDGLSIVSGSHDGTIYARTAGTARLIPSEENEDPVTALVCATLHDGWLTGPSGELLVWVPSKYRQYLPDRPFTLRIEPIGMVIKLDDRDWHRGENWTSCWRKSVRDTFAQQTLRALL